MRGIGSRRSPLAAMGRPRADEPGARERLLKAAEELFYQQGLRGAGIDAIVARAGVARMSLYHHFESKDALIEVFLRDQCEKWFEWLRRSVEQRASTARERLLAVFDALAERIRSADFRGCMFINAAAEIPDASHAARAIVREQKTRLRQFFRELAAEARLEDPEHVARALALLADGAIVSSQIEGGAAPVTWAREAAVAIIAERSKSPEEIESRPGEAVGERAPRPRERAQLTRATPQRRDDSFID